MQLNLFVYKRGVLLEIFQTYSVFIRLEYFHFIRVFIKYFLIAHGSKQIKRLTLEVKNEQFTYSTFTVCISGSFCISGKDSSFYSTLGSEKGRVSPQNFVQPPPPHMLNLRRTITPPTEKEISLLRQSFAENLRVQQHGGD